MRSRLDWKYALALELEDTGFDYSVLSQFRQRLLEGKAEDQLLDSLLDIFKEQGWLKAGGKQRTDSTHVLANVRILNRLEKVGQTMVSALESLAIVAPDWLVSITPPPWFTRYARRAENFRLPRSESEREAWAVQVGYDGFYLLACIQNSSMQAALSQIPAVVILEKVWEEQYERSAEGPPRFKSSASSPRLQVLGFKSSASSPRKSYRPRRSSLPLPTMRKRVSLRNTPPVGSVTKSISLRPVSQMFPIFLFMWKQPLPRFRMRTSSRRSIPS